MKAARTINQASKLTHKTFVNLVDFLRTHKEDMRKYETATEAASAISRIMGFVVVPFSLKSACEVAEAYYPSTRAPDRKKANGNGHGADSALVMATAEALLELAGPTFHGLAFAKLRTLVADAKVLEGFGKVSA